MELPQKLLEALAAVQSLGAITGAGVSQESGVRTYRGQGGLYDDPAEGDLTVEALSGTTLHTDPERTWKVVVELARKSLEAQPNAGHRALVEIEDKLDHFVLLTQNVDGLHQAAGSRNVIAIHGDVFDTVCMECQATGRFTREDFRAIEAAPRCEECSGVLRPGVVLFGESLPLLETTRLRNEFVQRIPECLLVAGTTALFPYIQQPVLLAKQAGRLTIEINPERTDLSDLVDYFLPGKAGTVLPLIAAALPSRG